MEVKKIDLFSGILIYALCTPSSRALPMSTAELIPKQCRMKLCIPNRSADPIQQKCPLSNMHVSIPPKKNTTKNKRKETTDKQYLTMQKNRSILTNSTLLRHLRRIPLPLPNPINDTHAPLIPRPIRPQQIPLLIPQLIPIHPPSPLRPAQKPQRALIDLPVRLDDQSVLVPLLEHGRGIPRLLHRGGRPDGFVGWVVGVGGCFFSGDGVGGGRATAF